MSPKPVGHTGVNSGTSGRGTRPCQDCSQVSKSPAPYNSTDCNFPDAVNTIPEKRDLFAILCPNGPHVEKIHVWRTSTLEQCRKGSQLLRRQFLTMWGPAHFLRECVIGFQDLVFGQLGYFLIVRLMGDSGQSRDGFLTQAISSATHLTSTKAPCLTSFHWLPTQNFPSEWVRCIPNFGWTEFLVCGVGVRWP